MYHKRLRRILRVISEIADGNEHDLTDVAECAGVDKDVLLADLKSLADRHRAPVGVTMAFIWLVPDRSIEEHVRSRV